MNYPEEYPFPDDNESMLEKNTRFIEELCWPIDDPDFARRVKDLLNPKTIVVDFPKDSNITLPFGLGEYWAVTRRELLSTKHVTPLMASVCSSRENVKYIKTYLSIGCLVDEKDMEWRTALMYATASLGDNNIFNLYTLLQLWASPWEEDDKEKQVLEYLPNSSDKNEIWFWYNAFITHRKTLFEIQMVTRFFLKKYPSYSEALKQFELQIIDNFRKAWKFQNENEES